MVNKACKLPNADDCGPMGDPFAGRVKGRAAAAGMVNIAAINNAQRTLVLGPANMAKASA